MARSAPTRSASGRHGGHDLHYRTLQALGVVLAGHLLAFEDGRVRFASDLADLVAFGDARYKDIRNLIRARAGGEGLPAPEFPDPPPFAADPRSIELGSLAVVVVTCGFRPDYRR